MTQLLLLLAGCQFHQGPRGEAMKSPYTYPTRGSQGFYPPIPIIIDEHCF